MSEVQKRKPGRPKEWTEDKILQVGKELEDWFLEDDSRTFYQEFFAIRRDLHPAMISRFQSVSDEFRQIVKRIELLAQARIIKMAQNGKGNPVFNIFHLKARHDWKDTKHVVSENHNYSHKDRSELARLSPDELKDRMRFLTEQVKN